MTELDRSARRIARRLIDYRRDEGIEITREHVVEWARQFPKASRPSLLRETAAVLSERYVSRRTARKFLRRVIEKLAERYAGGDPERLLRETEFLDLQPAGKSQSVMLAMLDDVVGAYGFDIASCGGAAPKRFLYLDDVLCTGNTLFYDLRQWWIESGSKKPAPVDCVFLALHQLNWGKVLARCRYDESLKGLPGLLSAWRTVEVENDLSLSGAALDFACPRVGTLSPQAHAYLVALEVNPGDVCRLEGRPRDEKLFTSADGRDEFEAAILDKGLELLGAVANPKANMRPLGFTLPSQKNLGFGALVFTWRNVPNNSPLVFWYDAPSFAPLFPKW